jgi:hypothetical protein
LEHSIFHKLRILLQLEKPKRTLAWPERERRNVRQDEPELFSHVPRSAKRQSSLTATPTRVAAARWDHIDDPRVPDDTPKLKHRPQPFLRRERIAEYRSSELVRLVELASGHSLRGVNQELASETG